MRFCARFSWRASRALSRTIISRQENSTVNLAGAVGRTAHNSSRRHRAALRAQVGRAWSALDDARLIALSRVFGLRAGSGARFECVDVVGGQSTARAAQREPLEGSRQTSVVELPRNHVPPRGGAIELLGHGTIGGSFSVGIAYGSWAPRFIPLGVAPLSGREANPDEDHDPVDLDRVDRARGRRRFDRIQVERAWPALDDARLIALSQCSAVIEDARPVIVRPSRIFVADEASQRTETFSRGHA